MKKERATKTTIYIDSEIYTQFKIYAITLNKSVSELIEGFMKKEITELSKIK